MADDNETNAAPQARNSGDASGPGASSGKVGSDPDAARQVGGAGDFGAPASGDRTADRDYVSRNTKRSDRGAAQPQDWEQDGVRDHGAGSAAGGPGSGSGGDLDPDIVGVGTGGGVAASGALHRPPGPDDSDGTSNEFAAGGPAQGENQTGVGQVGGSKRVPGSTIMAGP